MTSRSLRTSLLTLTICASACAGARQATPHAPHLTVPAKDYSAEAQPLPLPASTERTVVRAPTPDKWSPAASPLLGSAANSPPVPAASSVRAPAPDKWSPRTPPLLVPEGDTSEPVQPAQNASLWAGGLTDQPAPLTGPELPATELYTRVRESVFYIVGGDSYEQAIARKGSLVTGSAVAVSKHVMITNCHVVKDVRAIIAYSKSGFIRVRVLKQHPETDRCALEVIDDRELIPVTGVRAASQLKVGERVYTVGSPMGIESTLGEGIVSGLHQVKDITLVQTTAQVSPGSSGGGLFDTRGNLVGITTFKIKGEHSESLNFAIPASGFWSK